MERHGGSTEARAVRGVLWISFVLALVAYGFVGVFLFAPDARPTVLPAWLLPVVALVLGMGSLVVPGALAEKVTTSLGRPPKESPVAPGSPAPGSAAAPGSPPPSSSPRAPTAAAALPVPELVGWALAEGVGIVGLVSVVLGGSVRGLVVYLVAALALLVIRRPRG